MGGAKVFETYTEAAVKQGKEQYISHSNQVLAKQLAQKSYNVKVLKCAENRLHQIEMITKNYEIAEIEKLYTLLHDERQRLIVPVEPTWKQKLALWEKIQYNSKEFRECSQVIMTDRGERVRSKSEKILADYFYHHNITYKYEKPLHLRGFGIVYPDFTFLSKRLDKEIYWEHDGRMDDPEYARKAISKINLYEKNEIYIGERLIVTFETDTEVLSNGTIERMVQRYLLN